MDFNHTRTGEKLAGVRKLKSYGLRRGVNIDEIENIIISDRKRVSIFIMANSKQPGYLNG